MVCSEWSQNFGKWIAGVEKENSDYISFRIRENTEKSPGDLKRLPVTQIPMKGQQLTHE